MSAAGNGGLSELYIGDVRGSPILQPFKVRTPGGAPTGQVFNINQPLMGTGNSTDFTVSDGTHRGAAVFIFASRRGAITGWNPEPAAYDGGYAVRGVIQDRISGKLKGPWVGWGPYLWTDGLAGRIDGLQWTCDDVEADGTHPSKNGVQKVVTLLTTFFKTDPTAKRWYLARAHP